jgi:tetratricopeptide (TPR) repeat protein
MSTTQRGLILAEGEKLEKKGKLDAAIREYQKALRLSPGDVNLMNRLGDLHVKVNQVREAIEMFEKVADHFGRDGFYLKAIASYKKANRLDPQRTDIYEKLAEFSFKQGLAVDGRQYLTTVADWFIRQRQPKEAVRVYRALIDYEPTNFQARGKLVDLLVQLADVDGVVREIEALGQSLVAQGRLDEALKFFLRALALKPANADFVAPGLDALVNAHRAAEAAELAEKALAVGHAGPALQRAAARAFVAAGHPEQARAVLETLITGSGFGLQAAELYADAIAQIGDVDLEPAPLLPVVDMLIGAEDRGRAAVLLKPLLRSHAGELEVLERAVKVFRRDDDPELMLETEKALAEGYYRTGRTKEAAALYGELVKLLPHDEVIVRRLQKLGGTTPVRDAAAQPLEAAPPPPGPAEPGRKAAAAGRAARPVPVPEPEPEPSLAAPEVEIVDIDLDAAVPLADEVPVESPPVTFSLQAQGPPVTTPAEPLVDAVPSVLSTPGEAFEPAVEEAVEVAAELPPLVVAPPVTPQATAPPVVEAATEVSTDELFTEASVFAKYGLVDKAFVHLQRLLEAAPNHARGRELFDNLSRAHAPVVTFAAAPAAAAPTAATDTGTATWGGAAASEPKASVAAVPLETIGAAVGLSDTGSGAVAGDRAAQTGSFGGQELDFELVTEPGGQSAPAVPPVHDWHQVTPLPDGRAGLREPGPVLEAEAPGESLPGEPAEGEMFEITGVLSGPNFDVLKEVDFFIQQGLLDEAAQQLAKLHEAHGAHPDVMNRLAMLKARGWDEQVAPRPAEGSASQLFSEEEEFFDLAAELEKELAEEEMVQVARGAEPSSEVSIEDLFREFQRGVAEQVKEEDYDTHFNLGVAYREMGLLDEAIGEFQLALRAPEMFIDAASMIASCYTEKGLPEQAAQWYERALDAPDLVFEAKMGLRYELGRAHEAAGNGQAALASYAEVLALSPSFRDVVDRVARLKAN